MNVEDRPIGLDKFFDRTEIDLAKIMVQWLYIKGYMSPVFHDLRLSYFDAQVEIELYPYGNDQEG